MPGKVLTGPPTLDPPRRAPERRRAPGPDFGSSAKYACHVADPPLEAADERALAAALFNETWSLLEREGRTPEEDDLLVHAAHASAHHWRQVGEPMHFARSEWQCSRVYAVLGRAEPALHHARRCLAYCRQGDVEDWDVPFAYEALARAHAVAAAWDDAAHCEEEARRLGASIVDDEDRALLLSDLDSLPRRSDLSADSSTD